MSKAFVVVGAGVAGMTTALILARQGGRVVLVERAGACAPLVRGFRRRGVRFDTGFHYAGGLAPGEVFDRLLRYLGLAGRLRTVPFAGEGFDRCRFENPSLDFAFPVGEKRLAASLKETFPREGDAVEAFLREVRQVWSAFPYMRPEAPAAAIGAFDRLGGATLQQALDRQFQDPALKAVLSLHCLLHGSPPDEIPFALHACVVGPYFGSAHGLAGGGEALAAAFEQALADGGVEVRLGAEVSSIRCSAGGRVSGVVLASGEEVPCGGCVVTVHPRLLLAMVPAGAFRPAYRHRLERLEESAGGIILQAECRRTPPELERANLFLAADPGSVRDLTRRPLGQRPLFLSGCEPSPEGRGGFLAICPTAVEETANWRESRRGMRPDSYREFKLQALAALRARLRRQAPEIEGEIVAVDGATPLTYRDYVGSPFGSLYGIRHRAGQLGPQPQTRVEGLYLAGQAVAAPGVLGAMLSGFLACGAIFGEQTLLEELRRCA